MGLHPSQQVGLDMRALTLSLCLAALVVPLSASAEGYFYLQRFVEHYENGAAAAQVWVYNSEGLFMHSGTGNGAYEAGSDIPLDEGWYWVEVGRHRTEYNLTKLYVADGQRTLIPSGWASVTTIPVADQPRECDQWNAELTAFRIDENGGEHLVSNNRGTGVDEYGSLQLPSAGEFLIYFHGFPTRVEVHAGQVFRIPTGFQGPVQGERGQIALREEGATNNLVMALCEADNLHLPAGDYWVSRIVPIDTYPHEERVWNRVVVPSTNESGHFDVRAERVRDLYQGEGSEPQLITPADTEVLENYRRGAVAGGSGMGIDLTLP